MTVKSTEIEILITNIDSKIEYFQNLRGYATKEISRLLDVKDELIDTYISEEP